MFNLNPLNTPNAALQHWIMLVVAGTLGFIIGYISRKNRIARLEGDLAGISRELNDCHQTPVDQAATSSANDIVLRRIGARAGELDFARIGVASVSEADDLKAIAGVGPYLEQKLHAIGIYTFRQIANFTKDDVDKVTDIIEFFPGRIERDDWVGQSANFVKRT